MNKARILLILGILVTILPYLGFPSYWKDILSTLFGLILIYFSYILYKDYKMKEDKKKTFDNFSENKNFIDINVHARNTSQHDANEKI